MFQINDYILFFKKIIFGKIIKNENPILISIKDAKVIYQ
jgi:hypothetical protein